MKKLLLAALAAAAVGCASIPIPPERLEQSHATIRAAEEAGAAEVPSAKLYLQFAKDEERSARRLADKGDDRAHTMLACAQADAELALALAREAQVQRQTQQAAAAVHALETTGGER